ncbi:TetR/AcrR family transcriptional regulator [Kineococcus sp. SYSU DK002]|uniref:TetR/AcrR family transcriptional regulator n=1 Tax=Kineococcus sp. SYSU DK002 TaxID=3383123 RepID=UPI003D7CCC4D
MTVPDSPAERPPARVPAGAAVLRASVTSSVTAAVLEELAEVGYARTSMESVARRAGSGKSALYRRWPSKREMVLAAVAELSVPAGPTPDTGSLRSDLLALVQQVVQWLSDARVSRILPDLTAEAARTPELADAVAASIGRPRREHGAVVLRRAVERGELDPGIDEELALDLLAALVHWRLVVRRAEVDEHYVQQVVDVLERALRPAGPTA